MYNDLADNFAAFFSRLNPSERFTLTAAREYGTLKKVLEDHCELAPVCFLQGSYRENTAIHTINDVDVVALCRLWQGTGAPGGTPWDRDAIFAAVSRPLLERTRYRGKVQYGPNSMCIRVDLGIKVEILPVVYAGGTADPAREPFRLYRPASRRWEDGFARVHQARLSKKNADCNGNFVPAIKVMKHLRSLTGISTVSFHLECLLYALPDEIFRGSPADYLPSILDALGRIAQAPSARRSVRTPCGERLLFSPTEWDEEKWYEFCVALGFWAHSANGAANAPSRDNAIGYWKMLLGQDLFPARPARSRSEL